MANKIHNPYGFFMDFLWILNPLMDYGFSMEWIWIYDSEEHGLWNGYGFGFGFKSIRTH